MRITHVILTSSFAGSERYALELAAEQAKQHEVTLILRRAAMRESSRALGHRVSAKIGLQVVGDLFSGWQTRRWLRANPQDVVHGHLSRACKAIAGVGRCARVATLHIEYKSSQHARLDGLIAIAPWQMQAIPEHLRLRSRQINNWTQPQPVEPGVREHLRQAFGIGTKDFLFGSLGRIERSKGMDVLLAAHKQLNDPLAKLVVVGAGSELKQMQKASHAGAQFIGFSQQPQGWLSAFDAFVSPSRSEPFGLVMLEAMAQGLPIIASASQGAQHLAPKISRPLVPIGDAPALAGAMRCLMQGGKQRLEYDMREFDLHAQVEKIGAFYEQILAGPA